MPIWQIIIGKYYPTLLGECKKAILLFGEIVQKQLEEVMFSGYSDAKEKARKVVEKLNEHELTKILARHLNIDEVKDCGLLVEEVENDEELQDLLLTVHHCYMHTFANSAAIKIVENQTGIAVVSVGMNTR